jgi:uncharacterized protein (TIGR03382 family)
MRMRIAFKNVPALAGLALVSALTLPLTASAYLTGQPGASGRFGQKCADCHGPTQYDGVAIELPDANSSECWAEDDGGKLVKSKVWTASFGEEVAAKVVVTEPTGDKVPTCPERNACCDGGLEEISPQVACTLVGDCGEGEACWDFVNNTPVGAAGGTCGLDIVCEANTDCRVGVDTCGDPIVGFDAELVGGGSWTPGEGSRIRVTQSEPSTTCTGDADCGTGKICWDFSTQQASSDGLCGIPSSNEVVHNFPKGFSGGEAVWDVTLKFPTEDEVNPDNPTVEIWIGANIANGNGLPDLGDVNGNFLATIPLGGGDALPSYCATCEEGFDFDEEGNCVGVGGCGCAHLSDEGVPAAGLAALFGLMGLALVRRRRR